MALRKDPYFFVAPPEYVDSQVESLRTFAAKKCLHSADQYIVHLEKRFINEQYSLSKCRDIIVEHQRNAEQSRSTKKRLKLVVIFLCLLLPLSFFLGRHTVPAATASTSSPPATTSASTIQYAYVSSVNSSIFHKPSCYHVENIKESNLEGYATRNMAVSGGKTPCSSCKP